MLNKSKGNVCIDLLLGLICLNVACLLVISTVNLKKNLSLLNEDYEEVNEIWEDKRRCEIYCPKLDPIVDITY